MNLNTSIETIFLWLNIFQQKYSGLLRQTALFLIKGNCRDPQQYEMCSRQSLLLTPDGTSVSSFSIKPFTDFDSFLSCSRLTLFAVGSGRAPFCFPVLLCAVVVLDPSIQGLLLFPASLVKIKKTRFFFLTLPLTLFVLLEICLVFHFIQQPTFIKPAKTSRVFSSQTQASQVILVINPIFKRNFNPIPERYKGSALTSGPSCRRGNSLKKIQKNSLLAASLLKVMGLGRITLGRKHGHTVCTRADLAGTEWFPLNPALSNIVRQSFEHGRGV